MNRLLYTLTALALLNVLAFDPNFATNLASALGGTVPTSPLNSWEAWLAIIFVVLAAVALLREIRRPR